jgi:Tfp pilus assembly protein PilW
LLTRIREARRDEGFTLVEVMVAMGLGIMLSGLSLTAVVATNKSFRHDSDEASGLNDVRTVSERLERDLRDARGVDAAATTSQLSIWIDYNSDYQKQTSEVVTWRLAASTDPGHYNVLRSVQGGTTTIVARSLVSQIAFSYDVTPPATKVVKVSLTYDSVIGASATTRRLDFRARLRNVE